MDDGHEAPSPIEVADYVSTIASELTTLCEAARLDGLATILYAAHLEARRAVDRIGDGRPMRKRTVG